MCRNSIFVKSDYRQHQNLQLFKITKDFGCKIQLSVQKNKNWLSCQHVQVWKINQNNASNINMASIEKQRHGYSQKLQSFELNTRTKILWPLNLSATKDQTNFMGMWWNHINNTTMKLKKNKNKNIEYLESMFCEIIFNPFWCTNLELQTKLERTHYLMD